MNSSMFNRGELGYWKKTLCNFFASGFYSGYIPFAPGTWGTVVGLILAIFAHTLCPGFWQSAYAAFFVAVFIAFSILVSDRACQYQLYLNENKAKDPKQVVIDEIAGYFVAILFVEVSTAIFIAAFLLFRLFDIGKPPPIRQLERLGGGLGITLDDVVAGIFTNIAIRVIVYGFL